jgi:lipoyl-dependent peroxiredoxin
MQALYTATAAAVGGRNGSIKSSDGVLDLQLAYPKELGGPGGNATNPEQLFAAGYAACFENALLRVARERKAPIRESSVTAHVAIGRDAKGFFELAVVLEVSVPERDKAEIEEMVRTAHEEVCPYSHATRGNIDVKCRVI